MDRMQHVTPRSIRKHIRRLQSHLARENPILLEAVKSFRDAMQEMPEVLECHLLTGEFDYLLKIIAHNHRDLESFLVEKLTPLLTFFFRFFYFSDAKF